MPMFLEIASLIGSGALLAFSFWPYSLGWLAWFAWVPLLWLIDGKTLSQAFFRGWLFGTTSWLLGMYWFRGTISQFAHFPLLAAWFIFLLICAYHGLVFAIASAATRWFGSAWASVAALAFLDGYFPMLFPNHFANTQFSHLPMVQSADLFGMAGLAWLIAGSNAAIFSYVKNRRPRPLLAVVALILCNEVYGLTRMRQIDASVRSRMDGGGSLQVGMVQGAMPDATRFSPEQFQENQDVYRSLTQSAISSARVDLLVWPQNVYERIVSFDPGDSFWRSPMTEGRPLEAFLRTEIPIETPALVSAIARQGRGTYYAAFLDEPNGIAGFVAKKELTPLSEFLPGGDVFPGLYRLAPAGIVWLSRGTHRLLATQGGAKLGVYLCYEALSSSSAREYALMGAELLVNPSADRLMAGIEPEQDLRLGAMRAIETRKFLLRSTSSGISAVVDPVGRVVKRIPFHQRGWLVSRVALMNETTLFVRVGPILYVLAGLILLGTAALRWAGLGWAGARDEIDLR